MYARLGDMRAENQSDTVLSDTLEGPVFCMSRAFRTLVAPALPLQIAIFNGSSYFGLRIPFECTLRNLARDLRFFVDAPETNILDVMSTRRNFAGSRILISVFLGSWRQNNGSIERAQSSSLFMESLMDFIAPDNPIDTFLRHFCGPDRRPV